MIFLVKTGTRSSPWRYCGRKMRAAGLLGQRFFKENSKWRKSASCPRSSRFPTGRCRNDMDTSRVLGIPIPKTPVIWASPVTLILIITQIAKVIWEGDAHITRVFGVGMPKTRGAFITVTAARTQISRQWVHKSSGYELRVTLVHSSASGEKRIRWEKPQKQ